MGAEATSDLKFEIGHVLLHDIVAYSNLLIAKQREQLRELNALMQVKARMLNANPQQ